MMEMRDWSSNGLHYKERINDRATIRVRRRSREDREEIKEEG
jgi:hypothetical protein